MRVLVTGAAGFIGYHLVKRLVSQCEVCVGIDNLNDYYDPALKIARLASIGIVGELDFNKEYHSSLFDNLSFSRIDLEYDESLNELFEKYKFTHVINLAAQAGVRYSIENPMAYAKSNLVGFLNILECCRHHKVNHLSYASSSSVYGMNTQMPFSTSDNVDHPVSLYAATKKSNELMAHTYSHLYGLPTTGVRFFTVYGPWGRPDMAYFLFTKAILKGEPIKVFNNGEMSRDFTYIDDIVEGLVRINRNPATSDNQWSSEHPNPSSSSAPFKIYNIGNNGPVNLLEFIQTIESALGMEAKKTFMSMQPGDVAATYADVQDLIDNLGYKPKTSLEYGVGEFVKWYKEFYKV